MGKSLGTILLWALRLVVGGLFIYAGIVKIWDFHGKGWATQDFASDVQNFQLTTWTISIIVAVYLPWVELVAGGAILIRRWQFGALALLGGLTVVFLGAILSAWHRGLDISCGCFGKENNATNFPLHVAGDAALLVAIGLLWYLEARARKTAVTL